MTISKRPLTLLLITAWLCTLPACDTSVAPSPAEEVPLTPETVETPDGALDFWTDLYQLDAGEEAFFCYTMTLEEAMTVNHLNFQAAPSVHHLIMARTIAPEPDGFFECDVLFKTTWLPLLLSGAGDSNIQTPEGSGFKLEAGTQLIIQLHLLNYLPEAITDQVFVRMWEAEEEEVEPVGMMTFGTMDLDLPPQESSTVVGDCDLKEDVNVFAVFPHMHLLGTSVTVEAGPNEDEMTEIYRRDPWDFDDQSMDDLVFTLPKDSHVRTTCTYDNPSEDSVGFGESSFDEMCFVVTYATGIGAGVDGCFGSDSQSSSGFGTCEEVTPNDMGIGLPCTNAGDECPTGLQCTQDLSDESDIPGFCLSMGQCETDVDCGGGDAICCSPTELGGAITLCLPEECAFDSCLSD